MPITGNTAEQVFEQMRARLSGVIPEFELRHKAGLVLEINRLVTATPDGDMVRTEYLIESNGGPGEIEPAANEGDSSGILASDDLKAVVERVERLLIDRVMRRVKGNQSKGARVLGISRGALIAKIKEFAVPDYRFLRRRRK